MTAIVIFASTFVAVFALGFQSLNVNQGHYRAAALTSFAIGGGNLMILKMVPDGDIAAMSAYLIAGPLAIVASMWVHRRTLGKKFFQPQHPQQRSIKLTSPNSSSRSPASAARAKRPSNPSSRPPVMSSRQNCRKAAKPSCPASAS